MAVRLYCLHILRCDPLGSDPTAAPHSSVIARSAATWQSASPSRTHCVRVTRWVMASPCDPLGSDPTSACGRGREGSEWQRSARREPALSGEAAAGPRNRRFVCIFAFGENKRSHQCLHWWQQHATGMLHF